MYTGNNEEIMTATKTGERCFELVHASASVQTFVFCFQIKNLKRDS